MSKPAPSAASIFESRQDMIDEQTSDYDYLLDFWLRENDFFGLANIMIESDAENCLMAGAIALRSQKNTALAQSCWAKAERCLHALKAACLARSELTDDYSYRTKQAAIIPASKLYSLQACLLLNGSIDEWLEIRAIYELPFVSLYPSFLKDPDPLAAEARIMYAAHEGDCALVEVLNQSLTKHYNHFKLSSVYCELWKAVAARDAGALDSLLPKAADVFSSGAKRKDYDIWGGGKSYNPAMFDIYTTCVLKIARLAGMNVSVKEALYSEIWPAEIIAK